MVDNMTIVAAGSVVFAAGVPSWLWQNGGFSNTITDTGAGNIGLNLPTDGGVDASESVILATPRTTLAASGLQSCGVVHTSDTVKQVTLLQEGAAGAASALTDFNFDVLVARKDVV